MPTRPRTPTRRPADRQAPAPSAPASATKHMQNVAWRNAVYIAPAGTVRMRCQHPTCGACGLIVAVERDALDFATTAKTHVLCHDCRHPLHLIERPLGGAR